MRVIFVGIHNKPGLQPLCSSTRSGKLIDAVINRVQNSAYVSVSFKTFTFEKTNLYDMERMPMPGEITNRDAINKWATRAKWNKECKVVALGGIVIFAFKKTNIEIIEAGHPSAQWSEQRKKLFIDKVVRQILEPSLPF